MDDTKPRRAEPTASGRFLLRLPVALHQRLRAEACEAGVSLNEYCCRKLDAPVSSLGNGDDTADAVSWASRLFEDGLLAVLAYGSWARGEAQRDSDVDLLLVLDPRLPIHRDLYRRWDQRRIAIDGRPVEPHFVALPGRNRSSSGLWAEAALDGIVLFERGREVSRWLAHVRREIVAGRLVRRTAHGQPYWAEVA
jgi:predicted nucleotidyltransferase